ncbi:MAG: hypothetical protein K2G42_05975 [Clostridia bacterium]|nr:hypothetical protein [Clostridia bacterium]
MKEDNSANWGAMKNSDNIKNKILFEYDDGVEFSRYLSKRVLSKIIE